MPYHILIVDPNEAFATMLRQGLEEMTDVQADVVLSGTEAFRATAVRDYDLVIVDMGLSDVAAPVLARTLRQEHPHLGLVVIPLMGEQVPEELMGLNIQGVLPKPFFLPELPERIRAALSQSPQKPLTPGRPPVKTLPQQAPVIQTMSRLAQEVGAEAVLLTRGREVLAQAGRLSSEEVAALTVAICDSWRTSARVAQILGKEQLRFEQSIEGAEHLLYSLALADDLILSIVVAGRVPLGMIRHHAKETAETIRGLIAHEEQTGSD